MEGGWNDLRFLPFRATLQRGSPNRLRVAGENSRIEETSRTSIGYDQSYIGGRKQIQRSGNDHVDNGSRGGGSTLSLHDATTRFVSRGRLSRSRRISHGENALQQGKKDGRGRYVLTAVASVRAADPKRGRVDLSNALDLRVLQQPVVSIPSVKTGVLRGHFYSALEIAALTDSYDGSSYATGKPNHHVFFLRE